MSSLVWISGTRSILTSLKQAISVGYTNQQPSDTIYLQVDKHFITHNNTNGT